MMRLSDTKELLPALSRIGGVTEPAEDDLKIVTFDQWSYQVEGMAPSCGWTRYDTVAAEAVV